MAGFRCCRLDLRVGSFSVGGQRPFRFQPVAAAVGEQVSAPVKAHAISGQAATDRSYAEVRLRQGWLSDVAGDCLLTGVSWSR
jgi:hypothetical protein